MLHFVGAGSGAKDLITVRGANLLKNADIIIYAGSLVNPELLEYAKEDCEIYDSAAMDLEEVLSVIRRGSAEGRDIVRLHSGDPSLYGAIAEQIRPLKEENIPYDLTPGVSSFSAAAAALEAEFTPAGISQSLILTRTSGRTKTPELEDVALFAKHQTSMALFLSSSLVKETQEKLLEGGYPPGTPCAIVYRASWPDEKMMRCTVDTLYETAAANDISKTSLILVGDFLSGEGENSRLYASDFSTEYRKARK